MRAFKFFQKDEKPTRLAQLLRGLTERLQVAEDNNPELLLVRAVITPSRQSFDHYRMFLHENVEVVNSYMYGISMFFLNGIRYHHIRYADDLRGIRFDDYVVLDGAVELYEYDQIITALDNMYAINVSNEAL